MEKIKVLIADDHTIVRKGLCSLLSSENDIVIIGEAMDGREVIRKVGELSPDVIVLDINMPLLNGIEVTRNIKKIYPSIGIIILTMYSDEEYVHEALLAGASGFLIKNTIPQDLCSAIRAVSRGESFLSPSISRTVIKRYTKLGSSDQGELEEKDLTSREREVLQLIAEGHSNQEISELLFISPKTVEVHKQNIQKKLNISGTARLTQYAIRKGLIKIE
ncbi:MAG: response regulator transcription factor [Deltaproteobacteria bacterium]|nr:response regulator transcription factor [Deltaproteobacteria bacterium]